MSRFALFFLLAAGVTAMDAQCPSTYPEGR
jgi:hypothetical protein